MRCPTKLYRIPVFSVTHFLLGNVFHVMFECYITQICHYTAVITCKVYSEHYTKNNFINYYHINL